MNKNKKIGAWAAAFVALSFVAPAGANATPADISLGLTNPVTHVTDFETVSSSTTVADLRNTFVGVLGNGVAKHLLAFNGKNLPDSAKLSTLGLADGDQLTIGAPIGGLNVEVYKYNGSQSPSDSQITSKCSGPGVPTTVGTIHFYWGNGKVFNCDYDRVLVKFKGYVAFPSDRWVEFCTNSDDGNRVIVDGNEIVSDWQDQGSGGGCGTVEFSANVAKSFEYDFYENGGGAHVSVAYRSSENDGETWSNLTSVPTSAFINGSNWADESTNVVTGIDPSTHKLTDAGIAAVDAWYNAGGSSLSAVRLVGNTDNNSSSVARIELNSVRKELVKLGYTGTFGLVAHNGDRGNSDNGNVDEVILPAVSGPAAGDFWTVSGFDIGVDYKHAQFSYEWGTVSHTFDVQSNITSATVKTMINNAIDQHGPDSYSLNISLRDANDNELASNNWASSTTHGSQSKSITANYSGYVDHIVFSVSGIDNGYWAGYYGPTVHGANLSVVSNNG
jgi:hypothetical protein